MDQHRSAAGPAQAAAGATAVWRLLAHADLSARFLLVCFYRSALLIAGKHLVGVAIYIRPFSTWNFLGQKIHPPTPLN